MSNATDVPATVAPTTVLPVLPNVTATPSPAIGTPIPDPSFTGGPMPAEDGGDSNPRYLLTALAVLAALVSFFAILILICKRMGVNFSAKRRQRRAKHRRDVLRQIVEARGAGKDANLSEKELEQRLLKGRASEGGGLGGTAAEMEDDELIEFNAARLVHMKKMEGKPIVAIGGFDEFGNVVESDEEEEEEGDGGGGINLHQRRSIGSLGDVLSDRSSAVGKGSFHMSRDQSMRRVGSAMDEEDTPVVSANEERKMRDPTRRIDPWKMRPVTRSSDDLPGVPPIVAPVRRYPIPRMDVPRDAGGGEDGDGEFSLLPPHVLSTSSSMHLPQFRGGSFTSVPSNSFVGDRGLLSPRGGPQVLSRSQSVLDGTGRSPRLDASLGAMGDGPAGVTSPPMLPSLPPMKPRSGPTIMHRAISSSAPRLRLGALPQATHDDLL